MQPTEWILYFIPSHSLGHLVCLLNPTPLAPIHLPLDIFKPLVFSFSFKANLFPSRPIFLKFIYIPIYSLVIPNSVLRGLAISQPLVTLNISTNCLVIKTLRKKEKKKSSLWYPKATTARPCLLYTGLTLTTRPWCSLYGHKPSQRTSTSDKVTLRPW